MSFKTKKPPMLFTLSIEQFNKLLEYISDEKYKKLKEKLLKYSIPYLNEKEEEVVDIRLFISEAKDLINCFIEKNDCKPQIEYYSVLLKIREKMNVQNK